MWIIFLGGRNRLSDFQIEVKDVNKQYNNGKESVKVLDHISFGVKKGGNCHAAWEKWMWEKYDIEYGRWIRKGRQWRYSS